MLNLKRLFRNHSEVGSLSAMLNLLGFIDGQAFLTKSGEVGMALAVSGVDYECLETASVDGLTKRLESALRLFDENCRIYQYLCKRNDVEIPHSYCGKPVVDRAIRDRMNYFEQKSQSLFEMSIVWVVLLSPGGAKRSLARSLTQISANPRQGLEAILAHFSTETAVRLDSRAIDKVRNELRQKLEAFRTQVEDFASPRILDKQEVFTVLKRTINFDRDKLRQAHLKHDAFLDYYLAESQLECHRNFLRVDDYFVKVLTLKEPPSQTFPLLLKGLLDIRANFQIVSEWQKEAPGKSRRSIAARRRHFHNTRHSFLSQASLDERSTAEALVDESKESLVRELGDGISQMELHGNYFGRFSLAVVLYGRDVRELERAAAEVYKVFSVHDAQLYDERFNLLNAFLSTIPGNYIFNLRYLYLLNTNYADLSFLFTLRPGETRNSHLRSEYLAVVESNHGTPYYLNLHYRDTAHSMVLGRTGSGKSFLLNFLLTNLQKYDPHTFILDMGGSFEGLTRLFEGSYLRLGPETGDFTINPFCLPPDKSNLDFLALLVKVLLGPGDLEPEVDREIFEQIGNLYALEPELRTLEVLANTLPRSLSNRLLKWTRRGQFGFLFDNSRDTVSFARFQCFDFQQMAGYPELLEPLLFYILHRANQEITQPAVAGAFKAFFIDEAWVFLRHPSIRRYVTQALKTWRKHNAAMVLSTQSLDELQRSELLDVIVESCATKIFLANPDMDRDLYRRQFHLNETEISLIASLIPKRQFLWKTPELARVANLEVDARSYWLYTNDPYDNLKRRQAFAALGFEKGLDALVNPAG
jgi:type IV secretion system protein TrbE